MKRKNMSPVGVVVFIMLIVVFWDLFPIKIMHSNYCSSESGFTQAITLDEWISKYGVVTTELESIDENPINLNGVRRYRLNDRLVLDIVKEKIWHVLYKKSQSIRDVNAGVVLAEYAGFYTDLIDPIAPNAGESPRLRDLKIWLKFNYCEGEYNYNQRMKFNQFKKDIYLLGSKD